MGLLEMHEHPSPGRRPMSDLSPTLRGDHVEYSRELRRRDAPKIPVRGNAEVRAPIGDRAKKPPEDK